MINIEIKTASEQKRNKNHGEAILPFIKSFERIGMVPRNIL